MGLRLLSSSGPKKQTFPTSLKPLPSYLWNTRLLVFASCASGQSLSFSEASVFLWSFFKSMILKNQFLITQCTFTERYLKAMRASKKSSFPSTCDSQLHGPALLLPRTTSDTSFLHILTEKSLDRQANICTHTCASMNACVCMYVYVCKHVTFYTKNRILLHLAFFTYKTILEVFPYLFSHSFI